MEKTVQRRQGILGTAQTYANVWNTWQEIFTVSVNYFARAPRISQAEFEKGGTCSTPVHLRMSSSWLRAVLAEP
jgi:hypothetical protein